MQNGVSRSYCTSKDVLKIFAIDSWKLTSRNIVHLDSSNQTPLIFAFVVLILQLLVCAKVFQLFFLHKTNNSKKNLIKAEGLTHPNFLSKNLPQVISQEEKKRAHIKLLYVVAGAENWNKGRRDNWQWEKARENLS
jgi:hypothetical protein